MASKYGSLHVRGAGGKAASLTKLVTLIETFLKGRGYRVRSAKLDNLPDPSEDPSRIGVAVFKGSNGWRSVMLSDFDLFSPLAAHLSETLGGPALYTLAIYDDRWTYELYENGQKVSEFDSAVFRERQKELRKQLPQVEVPAEVLEIANRIRQAQATEDEMRQVATYMAENPDGAVAIAASTMSEMLGISLESAMSAFESAPVESALTPERQAALEPLLVDEDTLDELQEVLDEDSISPDATLSRFLPLLGIESAFADTEYEIAFVEMWYDPHEVLPPYLEVAKFLIGEPA